MRVYKTTQKPPDVEQMREALEACKQHLRETYGAWWNNHTARELMTKQINPALGLDPWQE